MAMSLFQNKWTWPQRQETQVWLLGPFPWPAITCAIFFPEKSHTHPLGVHILHTLSFDTHYWALATNETSPWTMCLEAVAISNAKNISKCFFQFAYLSWTWRNNSRSWTNQWITWMFLVLEGIGRVREGSSVLGRGTSMCKGPVVRDWYVRVRWRKGNRREKD